MLLAVPNISEGNNSEVLRAVRVAFQSSGARVLDIHTDVDHNRAVYSVASDPRSLIESLIAGAREVVQRIDLRDHRGKHPRVGALDVAPLVFIDRSQRGLASASALVLADRLGEELDLPVFLYGALGGGRTRSDLRRGGPTELQRRVSSGELSPDFGPHRLHATAGAVLVGARPPLIAFNVELAPTVSLKTAKQVASEIREDGIRGLPGVRALGLELAHRDVVQISTNIEDFERATPGDVVRAIQQRVPVRDAELVGLAPAASFDDFPSEIPLHNFDPLRSTIEAAILVP